MIPIAIGSTEHFEVSTYFYNMADAHDKKTLAIVDPIVGNYEKHPFFVKKANEARALLKAVGLPGKRAKAR